MLPSPFNNPALRDDLPRYPVLDELIRVTEAVVAGPAGVAQFAGSSVLAPVLYVAFVQQLRTDSLLPRDRVPCLAADMNGLGLLPGFYLGRLAGSWTSLPVYEIAFKVASGSSLTVEEDDGSPSVANVNRLRFVNTFFAVSQVSPGIAQVTQRQIATGATAELASNYSVSLGVGPAETGLSITLPAGVVIGGLFLLSANITLYATSNVDIEVHADLAVGGTRIPGSHRIIWADTTDDGNTRCTCSPITIIYAGGGGNTIDLRVWIDHGLGNAATVIGGTTGESKTTLSYLQIY